MVVSKQNLKAARVFSLWLHGHYLQRKIASILFQFPWLKTHSCILLFWTWKSTIYLTQICESSLKISPVKGNQGNHLPLRAIRACHEPSDSILDNWGYFGPIFAKPPQQEPIRDIQSKLLSSSLSFTVEEDPLIGCRYNLTLISSSQNHLYYNILEIFNFKPLYIIFKQTSMYPFI